MNNVNIIENGQQISVDLIAYFSNNNKNYLFYSKNETVQNGLIKMYVTSQNTGVQETITDDEWNSLKKIMQDIIMGNAGVNFIKYENPITINSAKAIALNDSNIASIKNAYNNAVSISQELGGTNKDLLAESFSTEPKVEETVQVSPIPDVQNNLNMEATPVNLSTSPSVEQPANDVIQPAVDSIPPVDSTNIEQSVNNTEQPVTDSIPSIESIASLNESIPVPDTTNINANPEPLTINSIKPAESETNNGIDSGFKVSNEPNIFDQPVVNTSENISPFNVENANASDPINNNSPLDNNALENISGSELNDASENNSGDSNIINASDKIKLNEKKIKLFEELANIYREENALLKNENNAPLEHTASDLFNNNGTLNELKVLSD